MEEDIDISELLLAIERLKFSRLVYRFRKKWDIDINEVRAKEVYGVKLDREGQIALNKKTYLKFMGDIAKLIRRSKCPRRYGVDLKVYLLTGLLCYHYEPVEIKQVWNKVTREKELSIRIYGDSKPSDFPKTYRKVLAYYIKKQPDFKKKRSEWTYYFEHKYIYYLKRRGCSMGIIESKVKAKYGYSVDEVEIRKITTRFKERMSLAK